ncbi:unnamed protein product [Effrenium voratum]|nr:unnamed protein product [Effrenium voratum]CAJ1454687.1 unnamed protein product [Effrenium voratum]
MRLTFPYLPSQMISRAQTGSPLNICLLHAFRLESSKPKTMTAPAEEDAGDAGAHKALLQFASSAKVGTLSEEALSEELEGIIRSLADNGAAACYPWDALRILLVTKLEKVLADFWHEAPDLKLREGETFDAAVEPLKRSLLEPRREGAPWTTQRLCELLAEPRSGYKSTRKYMYALQRAILITTTEEALAPRSAFQPRGALIETGVQGTVASETTTAAALSAAATLPEAEGAPVDASEVQEADESTAEVSTPAGRKRKLPEELSNGVVEE